MTTLRILAGLVAAACASSVLAATQPSPNLSGFYVVVPMEARAFAAAEGITVSLAGQALPSGLLGIPYKGHDFMKLLTVTGDQSYTGYGVKWSMLEGSLPAGLVLGADGRVTGTPTANGTSNFTVRATYKTKSGDQTYQLFVGKITIELDGIAPHQAIVGQAPLFQNSTQ